MHSVPEMNVVATWSGGIDSTAAIGNLLQRGYHVQAVSLIFGQIGFIEREREARRNLLPILQDIPKKYGTSGSLTHKEKKADWLWAFSHDGLEIPRRNKHIMDHLIVTEMIPQNIYNIAMGEYIGADTWVVTDHVSAADCDHRALGAYLYLEYGMKYRLISLADFGESRYKSDRLRLGLLSIGADAMGLTTNCMHASAIHCGECYKCQERAAAYKTLGLPDPTEYLYPPEKGDRYNLYLEQMTPSKRR